MSLMLPHPRQDVPQDGVLQTTALRLIVLPLDADDVDLAAAQLLQAELARVAGQTVPISKAQQPPLVTGTVVFTTAEMADPEGYALRITPTGATVAAGTARGRLWAVQTLRQLLRVHGAVLPCRVITDAPAMRYRGVLLDVARRKVPTVETLKELVDTLSLLKMNMLQLQVEHTFAWRHHPRIGANCGSLTCEDILALDAHCRRRGVELVPMLQSFGHMRNILMLPEYRHLAENEALQWSLHATDPASIRFVDELYAEYLPCFSSGLVNIGCDETIDLGRKGGKSNDVIAAKGKGQVYVDYLLALHTLLTEKYGKQVMLWGDIILHYPELVAGLPKDLIMLNWWYEAKERFDQVDVFAASGLPQIVCPGTSSWNTLFPRVNVAWENVGNFVRDGKAVGALGMLNTDWGDGGHYNLLGNSLYSYAHGAEVSWAPEPLAREEFEAALGPVLFGQDGAAVVEAVRLLGSQADRPEIVRGNWSQTVSLLFWSPMEDQSLRDLPEDVLSEMVAIAYAAGATFHQATAGSFVPEMVADMAWSADAIAYAVQKTSFLRQVMDLAEGQGDVDELIGVGQRLLGMHARVVEAFTTRWLAENRPSEITIALGRLAHTANVLGTMVDWLLTHRATFATHTPVPLPALPAYQPPWCEDCSNLWTPDAVEEQREVMG